MNVIARVVWEVVAAERGASADVVPTPRWMMMATTEEPMLGTGPLLRIMCEQIHVDRR
jgi:hypothetical protein